MSTPLICGTNIMKPPPKRVPILRYNAPLAQMVWTASGMLAGLIVAIPAWLLGLGWIVVTFLIIGATVGMLFGQVTYQGLPPHKAARRRARWTTRKKLAQPEGNRAAIYIGCCGPLNITHQTGTPISVVSGSRPAGTPLQDLVEGPVAR